MKSRILTAALLFAALVAPARADDAKPKPKPAPAAAAAGDPVVTAQIQPVGRSLADIRQVARAFGGKEAVEQFNAAINDKLGEKGFAGLDLLRPIVAYVPNGSLTADDISGVVAIPVSTEKDFLALLKRLDLDTEEVADNKGLYEIAIPNNDNGKDIFLRFANGHAYVGYNLDAAGMAADKLIAVNKLADPADTAVFTSRTYAQRLSKEAKAKSLEQIDNAAEMVKGLPVPEKARDRFTALLNAGKRFTEMQQKDGDVSLTQLFLDQKTLELTLDSRTKPLPGTQLAQDIAGRKPTTNQFAGLIGDRTAAGVIVRLPLFLPELRDAIVEGIDLGTETILEQVPEQNQAVAKEALAGVSRTVKSGQFDLAASLIGPDKDGRYSAQFAVAFEETAGLEKEAKKLVGTLPKEVANFVKLDAAKAGTVNIHKLNIGGFIPPEGQSVFGDEATLSVAFAPKGIYLVLGKDSVDTMKLALAAKPAEAKVMEVVYNAKRLQPLAAAVGMGDDANVKRLFAELGNKDQLRSLTSLSVEGGKDFLLRFKTRMRLDDAKPE